MPTELTLNMPDRMTDRLQTIARVNKVSAQEQALRFLAVAITAPADPANKAARLEAAEPMMAALRELLIAAGTPTARMLTQRMAQRRIKMITYQTINNVLNARTFPAWSTLESIVLALSGDVSKFRALWDDARAV